MGISTACPEFAEVEPHASVLLRESARARPFGASADSGMAVLKMIDARSDIALQLARAQRGCRSLPRDDCKPLSLDVLAAGNRKEG
jgi:hypothetical protein